VGAGQDECLEMIRRMVKAAELMKKMVLVAVVVLTGEKV
jgi:hypothetical protein